MPKKIVKKFACENCGAEYAAWQGQCNSCGQWNTIVEQEFSEKVTQFILKGSARSGAVSRPQKLSQVAALPRERFSSGSSELDRVLGGMVAGEAGELNPGGVEPGSVILLSGEPGIGKSTLLLQVAGNIAAGGGKVLYASAEESLEQIAGRADRLGLLGNDKHDGLELLATYDVDAIVAQLASTDYKLAIVDSIQTVLSADVKGIPGGIAQLRYAAVELITIAKQRGITLIVVGHINKEGTIAGPKLLEHMVDVVLQFSGEENSELRMLRASKNRFGALDEIGLFRMEETGMADVSDPGEYFTGQRGGANAKLPVGSCLSLVLEGKRSFLLEVQALAVKTEFAYPKRVSEGLPLSRLQMICAILARYLNLPIASYDIYVNIARGFKTADRTLDLAAALAIISSIKNKAVSNKLVALGELSLTGELLDPQFLDRRRRELARLGYKYVGPTSKIRYFRDLAAVLLEKH